jgi:Histidine kinase
VERIEALRGRLQPHFLFNTLNFITISGFSPVHRQPGEQRWDRGDSKCDERARMQFLKGA